MKGEIAERLPAPSQGPPQSTREAGDIEWPLLGNPGERLTRVGRGPTKKPRCMAAGWDGRDSESVVRQDVVYGLVMIFTETLEYHEIRRTYGEEELRHDLVGAAQVDQLDLGKIEEGREAV
jgi:hypothetical protein